jgi:hypothetical protein
VAPAITPTHANHLVACRRSSALPLVIRNLVTFVLCNLTTLSGRHYARMIPRWRKGGMACPNPLSGVALTKASKTSILSIVLWSAAGPCTTIPVRFRVWLPQETMNDSTRRDVQEPGHSCFSESAAPCRTPRARTWQNDPHPRLCVAERANRGLDKEEALAGCCKIA